MKETSNSSPLPIRDEPSGRIHWRPVLGVALLGLAVHLVFAGRYGFHRDELYYVAGGLRFEWGYVDHPFLVPWLAGWTTEVFGLSLRVLRLWPIVAGFVSVLLAAVFCARLGGGRRGQVLASLATVACPFFLFSHTVFQTNFLDQLAWCFALVLLLRGEQRARAGERIGVGTWFAVGAAAAVGFAAKYTVAVLGLALAVGILLRRRRELANPGLWLGGAIAALGLLPSALWQVRHGLPFLEFSDRAERFPPWTWLPLFALLFGLGALPLLWAGLRRLLDRAPEKVPAASLTGWTVAIALVLFLGTATKPYYPNALFVPLFAAGGAALGRTRKRWPEALLVLNLVVAPFMLPILPLSIYAQTPDPVGELAEMVGWPELVRQVEGAVAALDPEEREGLVIVTANYGEAAALELFGSGASPPVISGHNSYAFWIDDTLGDRPVERIVTLGFGRGGLEERFRTVRSLATISNPWGVQNQESGGAVFFAEDPVLPLDDARGVLAHFD